MAKVRDLADPNRCQGARTDGQCRNIAEPGDTKCRMCGGTDLMTAKEAQLYRLTTAKHNAAIERLAHHPESQNLRTEIAMVRSMVETMWNGCKSETDLLAASDSLNSMFLTLERLMKTSRQLEQNLGLLITKETLVRLAKEVVRIIVEELEGVPDYNKRVDAITSRMLPAIEQAKNSEEEQT